MKFSELSNKITEAEQRIGIKRICPYCQGEKWAIASAHKYVATFGANKPGSPHRIMPCLIMVCEKCGNMLFLHPDILGIDSYVEEEISYD